MTIIKKLAWFFRLEWWRYSLGILSLSLVALINLMPPRIMGYIVDSIDARQLTNTSLLLNISQLILVAFAMYGLRFIWRSYILGTANHLGRILRFRLFEHFTRMSPSFYQRHRTGDLMAHATNDINAVTMFAGGGVMSAVDASITALVTLFTMFFVLDWRLTLIAIIPLPFMAWVTSRLGRKNHESFRQAQESFADLNNKVQEATTGMKVTKSFGYQESEVASFAAVNQAVFEKNMRAAKYNALFNPMVLVFIGLSYMLSLVFGGIFITNGAFSLGELVTFIAYLDMLVWPLQAIGFLFNISQRGAVSYERIEALLAEESDVLESPTPLDQAENGQLHFEIEEFSYDGEVTTLEDVTFKVPICKIKLDRKSHLC